MEYQEIVKKLGSVNCLDDVKKIFNLKYTFYTEPYKKQLWELPLVTEHNKNSKIFNHYFFTLYANKYNDDDKNLVLVTGRLGNTHSYILNAL